MSNRDTILRLLRQADARIRARRSLERLGVGLALWTGPALLIKLVDLARPLTPETMQAFWLIWAAGAVAVGIWSFRLPRDLGSAAREIDRRTRFDDEFLSAWWFTRREEDGPGIGLHLERAAHRVRELDIGALFPWRVPGRSLLGAVSLIILLLLHLAPLPFPSGWALSGPRPDAPGTDDALLGEIEDLLREAEALAPDGSLGRFQALIEASPEELPPADMLSGLEELRSDLEDGNLTSTAILEGLEDMAEELMTAPETVAAAEALSGGDLAAAAEELDNLGEQLAAGQPFGEGLAQALERAAAEEGQGLQALADQLGEAGESLEGGDAGGAAEGLQAAAEALRDLADATRGQELRNLAAQGLETLETALSEQAAGMPPSEGQPGPGSGEAGGETSEGQPASDGSQPGESSGGNAGADASEGQGAAGGEPSGAGGEGAGGIPGAGEALAGGAGMSPAGLGISPAEKTGLASFLEVQLERVTTEAQSAGVESESGRREETREEPSRLDYRNAPSELSPADQELLEQDRIPAKYRNLIREYFQIIRETAP